VNEHLRQTGRTERMIQEAFFAVRQRRAVYVMVAQAEHVKPMIIRIDDAWLAFCEQHGMRDVVHGIKVETPRTLPFWNWTTMQLERAHPNCIVFVDHSAVEMQIEFLQRQIKAMAEQIGRLYPLTV